jgi:hypothetical protein
MTNIPGAVALIAGRGKKHSKTVNTITLRVHADKVYTVRETASRMSVLDKYRREIASVQVPEAWGTNWEFWCDSTNNWFFVYVAEKE